MATPTIPKLDASVLCTVGASVQEPVRGFLIIPDSDYLLTLEGTEWVTRSLTSGKIYQQTSVTPCEATEAMWADRVSSPDGRWFLALNGQSCIEFRPHENFEERKTIEWPATIPKQYGFWAVNPDVFLVCFENGVAEAWDLTTARRLCYSPERIEETSRVSHWAPGLPDGSVWLQLSKSHAGLCRARKGVEKDFRPVGRWPLAGGGISQDAKTVMLVTAGAPESDVPDPWIGGEILRFDLVTGELLGVCAHNIHSKKETRVLTSPTLSHVFLLTADGGLACVEAASGRTVWSIGLKPGAYSAAFSPDGKCCLLGLGNGEVVAMDTHSQQVLWRVQAHEFPAVCVGLSPDGRRAVSIGADHSLFCWEIEAGHPMAGTARLYDRTRDPMNLLVQGSAAAEALAARLESGSRTAVVGSQAFLLDTGKQLVRYSFQNPGEKETLWSHSGIPSPGANAYVIYEHVPDPKKKLAKLHIYLLDPDTGKRTEAACVEAPLEMKNPPLYLNRNRLLLPTPDGGLMLLRLDKKLFHPQVPLELSGIRLTGMTFFASVDGTAFAIALGAELRLFRSDDGKALARLVLEVPRREHQPAVVACRIAPHAKELILVLQSATIQHWTL
jgi:hypothetical protein